MREAVTNAFKKATSPTTDYLRYFAKDGPVIRLVALAIIVIGAPTSIVLLVWALKRFV